MNSLMASHQGSIQNLLGQSTSSLNTEQQELLLANYNLPGLRIDGRMSAVRRFFCLFVTFDLLFTALFWIICVLINGQNLKDGLSKEILHYTFQTSMFDIVVCSSFRFMLLLLFYAIIHIQHYWLVAITTLLSSAFLVAKSLLFQWNDSSGGSNSNSTSYPFQVLLLLLAFLLAWSEALFIDFSVMPQEARAKNLIRALNSGSRGGSITGGGEGGRLRDYLSQCTAESIANFYSPLQSPYESEDEDNESLHPKLTAQENVWQCLAVDAVLRAYDLLRAPGWQSLGGGGNITCRTSTAGKKIYRISAVLPAPSELLFRDAVDKLEEMPKWNSAVASVRKVQVLSPSADIVHHVSATTPSGLVTSRDFVMARHWRRVAGGPLDEWRVCWITGGLSIQHPDVPVTRHHIRGENGPGCWAFCERIGAPQECIFHWILETNLKGWLPRSVVESALSGSMSEQVQALRRHSLALVEANAAASGLNVTDVAAGPERRGDGGDESIISEGYSSLHLLTPDVSLSSGVNRTAHSLPRSELRQGNASHGYERDDSLHV